MKIKTMFPDGNIGKKRVDIIAPKLPTHRQVLCKTIFCILRNFYTHFNPYSTSVAI